MIKFNTDNTLAKDNVFAEQLHEDFPTVKDIDKLTNEQMVTIWLYAPAFYFRNSSKLSNYLEAKMDAEGLLTPEIDKQAGDNFKKSLAEQSKKVKEIK